MAEKKSVKTKKQTAKKTQSKPQKKPNVKNVEVGEIFKSERLLGLDTG